MSSVAGQVTPQADIKVVISQWHLSCKVDCCFCRPIRRVAMEGAIFAIHFVSNLVVSAFADRRPFWLAKTVAHSTFLASAALKIIATPPGQDDLHHIHSGGSVEPAQSRSWLSRAYIGDLRDAPRTHRFECVLWVSGSSAAQLPPDPDYVPR